MTENTGQNITVKSNPLKSLPKWRCLLQRQFNMIFQHYFDISDRIKHAVLFQLGPQ